MISQISNVINLATGSPGQPAPVAEFRPQQNATAVELPQQSVQPVESVNSESVRQAAEQLTKLVQQFDHNLRFLVDEETNKNVVKVVDIASKEVIRQIPSEEMLGIARALEKLQGLLIKDKA